MIEAQFDIKGFGNFVMAGQDIVSEAMWIFRPNGILEYTEMDPANVACVHAWIPDDRKGHHFDDNDFKVLVNLRLLRLIMRDTIGEGFFDQGIIALLKEDVVPSFLKLSFQGDKMVIVIGSFVMDVPVEACPEKEETKIPGTFEKFKAEVLIHQFVFKNMIKMLHKVGESVSFIVKDRKLMLKTVGDLMNAHYVIDDMVKGKDCSSKISLDYLEKLELPFQKLCIHIGDDYLLKIEDEIGDWFLIAPRVDND